MPKFSIITISKNRNFEIVSTINSVANQQFRDFEYIVIDGMSNDGTIETLKQQEAKINKLIIESDNGIYDAMNKGIKHAKGKYIIFLNAGDHFTTSYTLSAINNKVSQVNCEIYYGKIVWVNTERGDVITSKHEHIKYKEQLFSDNFPHPATIYLRESFEKYGLFDLDFPVYADYEWNLRALIKNNARFYYGDFIVTTFYTGGISTNKDNSEEKKLEKRIIVKKYKKIISFLTLKKHRLLMRV